MTIQRAPDLGRADSSETGMAGAVTGAPPETYRESRSMCRARCSRTHSSGIAGYSSHAGKTARRGPTHGSSDDRVTGPSYRASMHSPGQCDTDAP
jgi:hypothetical protein